MKKYIFSTVLITGLLIAATTVNAQQKPMLRHPNRKARMHKMKNKIQTMKVGFISKRLSLTPKEAEKFWPVYNQYEAARRTLKKNLRDQIKPGSKKLHQMTVAEIKQMLNARMEMKAQILALDKSYLSKYESVISVRQVAKLYRANRDFKMFLLKKLRGDHHGRKPHHPPKR